MPDQAVEIREIAGRFRLVDPSTGRPARDRAGFLDGGGFRTRREAEKAARTPRPAKANTGAPGPGGGFRGGGA